MAIGYSPAGAGLSDIGQMLMAFLLQRQNQKVGSQDRAAELAQRGKEFEEEMALRRADMEQRKSEFEQTRQENRDIRDENVALAQAPNLAADTPLEGLDPKVVATLQKYGILKGAATLPSTQTSSGMGMRDSQGNEVTGSTDPSTQPSPSQQYLFRPSTPAERTQNEMLGLEKARNTREEAAAKEAQRVSGLHTMTDAQTQQAEFAQRMKELVAQIQGQKDIANMPRRTSPAENAMVFYDWWGKQKPKDETDTEAMANWMQQGKQIMGLIENATGMHIPLPQADQGPGLTPITAVPPPGGAQKPGTGPMGIGDVASSLIKLGQRAGKPIENAQQSIVDFLMGSGGNPFQFQNKCPDGSFPVDGKCR